MDYQDALERYVGHRVAVTTFGSIRIWGTVLVVNEDHVRLGQTVVTNEHEDHGWFGQMQYGDADSHSGPYNTETIVQFHQIVAINCQDEIDDEPVEPRRVERRSADLEENSGDSSGDLPESRAAGIPVSGAAILPQEDPALKQLLVDRCLLEVGIGLVKLVEPSEGFSYRLGLVRGQVARDLGIVAPEIRIAENLMLPQGGYRILIEGVAAALGEVTVGHVLAIDSGQVTQRIEGEFRHEPVYGLPSLWIPIERREEAEKSGYLTCDAGAAIAVHVQQVLQQQAAQLFSLDDAREALQRVEKQAPTTVAEVERRIALPVIHSTLSRLLEEGVSIRPLVRILQGLARAACDSDEEEHLVKAARLAIRPYILESIRHEDGRIHAYGLSGELAELLLRQRKHGTQFGLTCGALAEMLAQVVDDTSIDRRSPLVLIVPDLLRGPLWKEIRNRFSHVRILAEGEIVEPYQVRMHRRLEITEDPDATLSPLVEPVAAKEEVAGVDASRPRTVEASPAVEVAPRQPR